MPHTAVREVQQLDLQLALAEVCFQEGQELAEHLVSAAELDVIDMLGGYAVQLTLGVPRDELIIMVGRPTSKLVVRGLCQLQ